jgi:hypothetical protein
MLQITEYYLVNVVQGSKLATTVFLSAQLVNTENSLTMTVATNTLNISLQLQKVYDL